MQLILDKRGASLSVKSGRYLIRYDDQQHWVPPRNVKSICLHPATKITHEAIITALEHDTDVQFIDGKGFPVGRVWSGRFGSISTIRKNQLTFAASLKAADWIRYLLIRKADNQLAVLGLLATLRPDARADLDAAAAVAERYKRKLFKWQVTDLQETYASFRGYEGMIGKAYFGAIAAWLPERYRFARRSQHPARDMFNCLLNYAYGMLYGYVEGALIRAGLDPYLGIMHRDEYNRPVLTYDVIEVYRCWADYVVCHLCGQEVIFEDFFDQPNGNFWLNAAGKRILIQSMNDYLSEIIEMNKLSRSRLTHIDLEAQQWAAMLKRGGREEG